MTVYSYAELEGLWISAGGPRAEAPIAAAIALAESQGNSDAFNPKDSNGRGGTQVSAGLWQISNGTMSPVPGWADPQANARLAVAKWRAGSPKCGPGPNFCPWGTFTSGAFKSHLSGKTTPVMTASQSPTALAAQVGAAQLTDCLVPNPLGVSIGPLNLSAGPACILSRSQARAFIGAGLMLLGLPIALAGLVALGVAAGMRVAGPAGKAAEGVGGALLLVPGAEGAGAALMAAGRTAQSPAREGRARQQRQAREEEQGRRQWQRTIERANREEDREVLLRHRAQGEPRENRNLETRGGTVRESSSDQAARQRRQAASRARARRSAGQGRPASREEAGF